MPSAARVPHGACKPELLGTGRPFSHRLQTCPGKTPDLMPSRACGYRWPGGSPAVRAPVGGHRPVRRANTTADECHTHRLGSVAGCVEFVTNRPFPLPWSGMLWTPSVEKL